MPDFNALRPHKRPFQHWIADDFVDRATVEAINREWPAADAPGWRLETGAGTTAKGSLLFPRRLPAPAQALADACCTPEALAGLSALLGLQVLPDPWMHDGPLAPPLGGGLHEIHRGGQLRVHVDFEAHPSGLRRVANLLIYLNLEWRAEWAGALELHGSTKAAPHHVAKACEISPIGGRAVLFRTTPSSWHGHPRPLASPADVTRRSLALYFYAADGGEPARPKTVYRR